MKGVAPFAPWSMAHQTRNCGPKRIRYVDRYRRYERRDAARLRNARLAGGGVEYPRRSPRVAKILKRQESSPDRFSGLIIAARARFIDLIAQSWGDTSGASRKAGQFPIPHVYDRGPLTDSADYLVPIYSPQQSRQILVTPTTTRS